MVMILYLSLRQVKDQPRDLGFGQVLFSLMFMPLTRRLTIVIFKAQHLKPAKEGFPGQTGLQYEKILARAVDTNDIINVLLYQMILYFTFSSFTLVLRTKEENPPFAFF